MNNVSAAAGAVIRQIREAKGLRLADMAELTGIGVPTLSGYETGAKQLYLQRFVNVCVALECEPTEVLGKALAYVDNVTASVTVDLEKIVADTRRVLKPLRNWAKAHAAAGHKYMILEPDMLAVMADFCGLDHATMYTYAKEFEEV